MVLTSDVIVGFPGETTEEFEDTLSLVEQVRFDALFTFIYSPRKGYPGGGDARPHFTRRRSRPASTAWWKLRTASPWRSTRRIGTVQRCLVDRGRRIPGTISPPAPPAAGWSIWTETGADWTVVDVEITDCSTWALFWQEA